MALRLNPYLLIVGSSNTDVVIQCPRLPRAGETILGGEFFQFGGGKGANQAVAAARAGAQVNFIGARGDDVFGATAAEALQREGIDVRGFIVKKHHPSGLAMILVGGKEKQNMIVVARSANDALSSVDIRKHKARFKNSSAIVAQLEVPLSVIETVSLMAMKLKVPFILNPAPASSLPKKILQRVNVLTPNEHEARILARKQNLRECGIWLQKAGCQRVVITLGPRGVWVFDKKHHEIIPPPFRVKPVDTVGAGDCFTAWLAVGIAEDLPFLSATRRAMVAAGICVTRFGAQKSMPKRSEVEQLIKNDH